MPLDTSASVQAPVFTVTPTQTHQTVEGFGASGAWWSQYLGGWSDKNRSTVADLLFSTNKGIGLTQYRYNLGGGKDDTITDPWRTSETFMVSPGVYDWSQDKNARWFLQAAQKRGVKDFVAFANSAPRQLTKNGHTYGANGQSNLAPENYEAFADYLADVTEHFRRKEGVTFDYVSPINEPQWGWDGPSQEGSHFEADEVCAVTETVVDTFGARRLGAEISAPEAGEYRSVYEAASGDDGFYAEALFDGCVEDDVDHFAVHSYWSNDDQRLAAAEFMATNYPDKDLHMTEWTEMQGGRDYGVDSALTLAKTLHADLTLANVTSWQYWIAVSRYDYHDGLLYTDYVLPGDEETFAETKKLWALGNFSRFVRPGAVRVDVAGSQNQGQQAEVTMVTPVLERTETGEGTRLFRLEDPSGDDHGPSTYSYPMNSVFTPGSFDFRSVELIDAGDEVVFKLTVGEDLYDPWNGSPVGYDIQNFDIYVDKGEGGFTDLLPGRRAKVVPEQAWDFAVFATGRTDLAQNDVEAKVSPEMQAKLFVPDETQQSVSGNTLTIRVPKSVIGEPQPGWSYQFAVTGSEGNMLADSLRVREVTENSSDWQFGGGSDGTSDPNVIDLFVSDGQKQEAALAWQAPAGEGVLVSAFHHPRNKDLVVVAINQGDQAAMIDLHIPSEKALKLTPYRTSEREDLERLGSVRLVVEASTAQGTVTLAPKSITTYVAKYSERP